MCAVSVQNSVQKVLQKSTSTPRTHNLQMLGGKRREVHRADDRRPGPAAAAERAVSEAREPLQKPPKVLGGFQRQPAQQNGASRLDLCDDALRAGGKKSLATGFERK
jgi:hypothetical protein